MDALGTCRHTAVVDGLYYGLFGLLQTRSTGLSVFRVQSLSCAQHGLRSRDTRGHFIPVHAHTCACSCVHFMLGYGACPQAWHRPAAVAMPARCAVCGVRCAVTPEAKQCLTCCASHAVPQMLCLKCCASHAVPHMLCLKCCASYAVPQMLCLTCCASNAVPHMLCLICCASYAVPLCFVASGQWQRWWS